jgi:hypothetical protein
MTDAVITCAITTVVMIGVMIGDVLCAMMMTIAVVMTATKMITSG